MKAGVMLVLDSEMRHNSGVRDDRPLTHKGVLDDG
jgi:hypothetical protein